MLNVRLADDHLHGILLFTWLSLVMSLMVSFCAVPFPTIWDLIGSVFEGVPVCFCTVDEKCKLFYKQHKTKMQFL